MPEPNAVSQPDPKADTNVKHPARDLGDQAVDDILSSISLMGEEGEKKSETPAPVKPEEPKPETKPAGESEPPKEPKAEPESPPTTPPAEEKTETPFATIGNRTFKTPEEVVEFAKSQYGYNTWLTGWVKKFAPEAIDEAGKIDSKKLEEVVRSGRSPEPPKPAAVKEAAETLQTLGENEELSEEEKADLENAKKILRKVGVAFKEDLQPLITDIDQRQIKFVRDEIDAFINSHSDFHEYQEDVRNILQKNIVLAEAKRRGVEVPDEMFKTIEQAYNEARANRGVTPPASPTTPERKGFDAGVKEGLKKKEIDGQIPPQTPKSSGPTQPVTKDFFDDLIGIKTL